MKNTHFLIASHERASLKKWWLLAGILGIITVLVTTLCTMRMYRIISANESVMPSIIQPPAIEKMPLPQVTVILEQITDRLPGSVSFTALQLENDHLTIQGKTIDQHAWATWTEILECVEWVSEIKVEYLQKIPKKNVYSFSLSLCF